MVVYVSFLNNQLKKGNVMSRSFKKIAICGFSLAESDKSWKKQSNKNYRAKIKQELNSFLLNKSDSKKQHRLALLSNEDLNNYVFFENYDFVGLSSDFLDLNLIDLKSVYNKCWSCKDGKQYISFRSKHYEKTIRK